MYASPGSWYPTRQLEEVPTMWKAAELPCNKNTSVMFKCLKKIQFIIDQNEIVSVFRAGKV